MSDLESTQAKLEAARRNAAVDPLAYADALLQHANALVRIGQLAEACTHVDEAASLHAQRGDGFNQSRSLHMAASICRLGGRLADAKQRAQKALDCVNAQGPMAVSAYVELGEIAMLDADAEAAAAAWTAAMEVAAAAGHAESFRPALAALLRKRAIAWVNLSRHDAALADLAQAHDLLMQLGELKGALRVMIEQATALHYAGRAEESAALIQQAITQGEQAEDFAALADIWMLVAAQAFERRDAGSALSAARTAQDAALQAVVPQAYYGASVAISRAENALGNQLEAYRVLATAWVTLGDAIGKEGAQAWVEPVLGALRDEWGAERFAEIRAQHDAERRAALGRGA